MSSLELILKEVYFYLNALTLSGKIEFLSEVVEMPVKRVAESFFIEGIERDLKYTENYVSYYLHWLKMSDIDKIYYHLKLNNTMEHKDINDLINVTLCGRTNTCCPVLSEHSDNTFTLTDDYNGKVTLTRDELIILRDTLNEHLK